MNITQIKNSIGLVLGLLATSTAVSYGSVLAENNDETTVSQGSYFVPIALTNNSQSIHGNKLIIPLKRFNVAGSAYLMSTDHAAMQTKEHGLAYIVYPGETIHMMASYAKSATVECKFDLMDNKYCDVNIFDSKLPKDGALVAFEVFNTESSDWSLLKGVFVAGVTPGGSIVSALYEYDTHSKIYTLTEKALKEPWFSSTYDEISINSKGLDYNRDGQGFHFHMIYQ